MADKPISLARRCFRILARDAELLEKIDNYSRGIHDQPYIPVGATAEYRLLAERCTTNLTEFIVGTVAQAMYVDGFRRSSTLTEAAVVGDGNKPDVEPEWEHWQRSRLDARQSQVYRGALTFGHSFVVTEKVDGHAVSRGLSPMKTSAVFEDPASDDDALMVLSIVSYPSMDGKTPGRAKAWDQEWTYNLVFSSMDDDTTLNVVDRSRHGLGKNPVTRFPAAVDLEGRTTGVIEPLIPVQDRLNQTVFDMLVVQTYSSTKVRTVTGMAPPMKTRAVKDADGNVTGAEVIIDPDTGQPIPAEMNVNASRFLFAEDDKVKFGTLDETPLDGFISSIEMSFKHIAALSSTPPHFLLGQIANLSAEALQAAETALQRKVAEFQATFGESWERVFRIAAQLEGDTALLDDYSGEVLWRDMEQRSMAQAGDALSKFKNDLEIPAEGLWNRVPGVTSSEIAHWKALKDKEDQNGQMADALQRIASSTMPTFRDETQSDTTEGYTGPVDATQGVVLNDTPTGY